MNAQYLSQDVGKIKKIWSLNSSAANELAAMHKLYLDLYEANKNYSTADADLAAFLQWYQRMSEAYSTGFVSTSAVNIYTSAIVNRLSKQPPEAISCAEELAAFVGLSYAGIVKAISSYNQSSKPKVVSGLSSYERQVRRSWETKSSYEPAPPTQYPPTPSGCTGGCNRPTRC